MKHTVHVSKRRIKLDNSLTSLTKKMIIAATVLVAVTLIIVVTIVACAATIPFDYYWALGFSAALLIIAITTFVLIYFVKKAHEVDKTSSLSLEKIYGPQINKAYVLGGIALMVTDDDDTVVWQSDYLNQLNFASIGHNLKEGINQPQEKRFGMKQKQVDTEMNNLFAGLLKLKESEDPDRYVTLSYKDKTFEVKTIHQDHLYIFRDITNYKKRLDRYISLSPLVGFIKIDNYTELSSSTEENSFNTWMTTTRKTIEEWAKANKLYMRGIKDGTYLILGNNANKPTVGADNDLEVLTLVSQPTGGKITLSIGMADSYPDFVSAMNIANQNADVAAARGGDQAIFTSYNSGNVFIGGRHEKNEKHLNGARIRLLSKNFFDVLHDSTNVLTVGHFNADFDSIGACLGVKSICDALNIPCKIIYAPENTEPECRRCFEDQYGDELSKITVDYSEALDSIKADTLLVTVDVCDPKRLIYPNIITPENDIKVAIVDHHRPGEQTFKNIVFNGSESTASSACELISAFVERAPIPVKLPPKVATFMLAGTMVDTTSYRNKTNASTLRAMAYLRSIGGSVVNADQMTKESYAQFKTKMRFLSNAETLTNRITVCTSPNPDEIVDRTMLAIVSNQAMDIQETEAAFTIGYVSKNTVCLSARSNGRYNVEGVARHFGGGGHFSAAAATIRDTTVAAVKADLIDFLNDYFGSNSPGSKRSTSTGTYTTQNTTNNYKVLTTTAERRKNS